VDRDQVAVAERAKDLNQASLGTPAPDGYAMYPAAANDIIRSIPAFPPRRFMPDQRPE